MGSARLSALRATAIRRSAWRAVAVLITVAVALGTDAAPAFAHAQLLSTSPASGATLATSPPQVVLTFGEDVQAETNAIAVLTASGSSVAVGASHHPPGRGDQVAASLPGRLHGTYVVTWRVISADTHPVQGAFTFSVGAPTGGGLTSGLEQHALSARKGSSTVGTLEGINRFATFAAVIALVGAAGLLLAGWRGGLSRRRARWYLIAAAGLTALFALTGIGLQGVYGAGRPLGDIFASRDLNPAVNSRFGVMSLVRAGVAIVGAAAVAIWWRGSRSTSPSRQAATITAAAGAVAVVVTVSFSGHGDTGRWQPLGLLLDIVHVAAGSVWIGGLAFVVVCVLSPGAGTDPAETEHVVQAFSRLVVVALAAVVVTGVIQAWRQIGSWHLVSSSSYGHLLLLKLVAVAAVAEAGWLSRRWIHNRLSQGREFDIRRFRRWIGLETALGVVIVIVTSLLVNAAPPRTAAPSAPPQPVSVTIPDGPYTLGARITPAAVGENTVSLSLANGQGAPVKPFQLYAQLNLPAKHLGPLGVPLAQTSPGHWAGTLTIPLSGTWQLYVGLLTSASNEIDKAIPFDVGN